MQEGGVEVDHSSLNRWVLKYTPVLDKVFRQRKLSVGTSWRMALGQFLDETYTSVKGQWKYWYRAVDKAGRTDFHLTAKRDRKAASRFLRKAIDQCGVPQKITIDKSGANTVAIEQYNTDHEGSIELRQAKCLNNIVEQEHCAIKRMTRPNAGTQIVLVSSHHSRRNRMHAHDSQGPIAIERGVRPPPQRSSIRWPNKAARRSVFARSRENLRHNPR